MVASPWYHENLLASADEFRSAEGMVVAFGMRKMKVSRWQAGRWSFSGDQLLFSDGEQ